MKIAIIGGSGHFRYALDQLKNHTFLGIAPGVIGEDLGKLQEALADRKIDAPVFDDWKKLAAQDTLADFAIIST